MKTAASGRNVLRCDAVVEETVATPSTLPNYDEARAVDWTLLPRPGWVIAPLVFLHLQLHIRKRHLATGETRPLEVGDRCAILNFPAATIWRTAEILFGPYLISATNAAHTYFCYLQALLTLPADVKRSILARTALWAPDTATNFDVHDVHANAGYARRSLPFAGDRLVELYAPLQFDVFRQPNPFPDDLTITVKLNRNTHRFCLNGAPEAGWTFELGIHRADLCITRYRPVQRYRVGDLHFPLRGFASRFTVVSAGNATASIDILDQIAGVPRPDFVGVGMLTQEAFNGAFGANAFNFQLFELKSAHLLLNNATQLPPLGYQFETAAYDNGAAFAVRYLKSYVECMRAAPTGLPLPDAEPPIDYDEFAGGCGMLWWDLRNDRRTAGAHDRSALNLRYVAEHWTPLAQPIVLLSVFFSERVLTLKQSGLVELK